MATEVPKQKTSAIVPIYNGLSFTTRIASGLSIIIMVLFLVPLILPYVKNTTSYGYINSALTVEHGITTFVKATIPTMIGGKDMTRPIVVVGMFLLSGVFARMGERLHGKAEYIRFQKNYEMWKSQLHLSDNSILLSPLNKKLEHLQPTKKKDRDELLKVFASTKKKLDEMGKDMAFLAIDVVDSTGMKDGEERAAIEHDFKEYKRFVEGTLLAHGCLKSTWTPDGSMSAFPTVDAAVRAAREVIIGIEAFNKHVKAMRRDFMVRCGVNSGFVYFDPNVPLEEISDRVIDIAGHMQKHSPPNAVCVARLAIEPLVERSGFEPSGRIVDGYEVYEWRKS